MKMTIVTYHFIKVLNYYKVHFILFYTMKIKSIYFKNIYIMIILELKKISIMLNIMIFFKIKTEFYTFCK